MSPQPDLACEIAAAWPPHLWTRQRVVVAVSGGPDSVALLRGLLHLLGDDRSGLSVAHFNHQLRGAEADDDEAFVQHLATSRGLACDVGRAEQYREAPPRSAAGARELRYAFLQESAARRGARYLAVAHTADDQAETILHRILRGTGIEGLRGMPARRRLSEAVTLVRPALGIRRATILDYLQAIGQPYREDSSNRAQRSSRSRLRHGLLPLLASDYNPRVIESLLRLGEQATELYAQLEAQATEALEEVASPCGAAWDIDCRRLAAYPPAVVRACLAKLWRQRQWPERAMGRREWKSLMAMTQADDGAPRRRDFPGAVDAVREGSVLHLERRPLSSAAEGQRT